MKSNKLFEAFPPVTKEQWKQKAIHDIKDLDFDKNLVWKTQEGFSIQPYYAQEDIQGLENYIEAFASVQKTKPGWIKYVEIMDGDVHTINQQAVKAIKQGATGLLLHARHNVIPDFEIVLSEIDTSTIHVSFKLDKPSGEFIQSYFDYLKKSGVRLSHINGFCECETLAQWNDAVDYKALAAQLSVTQQAPNFFGLVTSSHTFANAGSNLSQELAFTLNKITDYIEYLSHEPLSTREVIHEIFIRLTISPNYFFEIAKVRSMRLLWATLMSAYGESDVPIQILSSTSLLLRSVIDPNMTMLSNTTEAMSAVLGGCDALLIDSHTNNETDFGKRIALNISNLLDGEAYFDKVIDPSQGSYYIENLTQLMTENAFSIFKEIEHEGGFIKALEKNIIQDKIESTKENKDYSTSKISTQSSEA